MAKDPAAVALGKKGGKATAANRSEKERAEAARRAARARWAKADKLVAEIKKGGKELLKATALRRSKEKASQ